MHLSGDGFYIRGLINDETAQLLAQLVGTNGVTNEIAGIVERNGMFWVEGLPLGAGSNNLTIIASDAAGNVSSTNLSVVKSSVTLTIDSTPTGESLYTPNGTVSGTVSDTNYSVTVNGVTATVDENGNWTAANVPVMGQGTATFDALAHPSSGGGGGPPTTTSVELEMPAFVAIVKHSVGKGTTFTAPGYFSSYTRTKNYSATVQADPFGDWVGNWLTSFLGTATDNYQDNNGSTTTVYAWTATNRSTHITDSLGNDTTSTNIVENYGSVTGVPDMDLSELGSTGDPPTFVHHYYARRIRYKWDYGLLGGATAYVGANTDMKLYTGGKARVGRKSLIHITGNAASYGRAPDQPWLHTPITQVDPTRIQVLGCWLLGRGISDPNGDLYLALPDNAVKDLNMRVWGAKHYGARASASRHKLVHETLYPALTDANLARTQLGVGEYVNCGFEPGGFPTNATWSTMSGSLDTSVGNWVWYTAPSNAGSATVAVDVAGTSRA